MADPSSIFSSDASGDEVVFGIDGQTLKLGRQKRENPPHVFAYDALKIALPPSR